MLYVQQSVEIERSCSDVFAFVTDIRNDKLWWKNVTASELTTPGPIGVGSQFSQHATVGPLKVTNHLTVLTYIPPHRFSMENVDSGIDYVTHYVFEALNPTKTRYTMYAEITLGPLIGLLKPLLIRIHDKELRTFFGVLKTVLEQQAH